MAHSITQADKAARFRALHTRPGAFIMPNPWDAGSARLFASLGFEALATTSMGYAFSTGRLDGAIDRDETLAYASAIVGASDLPVSADLDHGCADAPETVAETIRLAARAGVVGGSIEDATGRPEAPIYDRVLAAERVHAAAEAARTLPFPFTLTARADNHLHGRSDLADTIARLQAYQDAGADVLYAPGLATRDEIASVVGSVDRPVNVVVGLRGATFTLAELAAMGVRRVSVGSAVYRTALAACLRAGREMRDQGTFTFAGEALGPAEIAALLRAPAPPAGRRSVSP